MLVTKCGSSTLSQTVWNGNTHHSHKKFEISSNSRKSCVLRFTETNPWALSGKGCNNSTHYNEILHDKLKLMIQSKHWGNLTKDDVLLQENVCPHTFTHTIQAVQTLQKLWSKILTISTIQPWPCTIRFSSVCTPQRCFKRSLFCQWTSVNGGGVYVSCQLDENIILMAYIQLHHLIYLHKY